MRISEALLASLIEGNLKPQYFEQVMPYHCLDKRYKESDQFMNHFYPAGYGGMSPGPTLGSYGDGIGTLCFLTAEKRLPYYSSTSNGLPIAAIVGMHIDCGFSKKEISSLDPIEVEIRTWNRTNSDFEKLIRRDDIAPCLESQRLALVLTQTTFICDCIQYRVLGQQTNQHLEAAGLPGLSPEFVERFRSKVLVFDTQSQVKQVANCAA